MAQRPKKVDITGMSPIRREFHNLKARNATIDEYETYLAELGIELPEDTVEEAIDITSSDNDEGVNTLDFEEEIGSAKEIEEEVDLAASEEKGE